MGVFEAGRVCVKNSGRDAGKRCVITKVIDANFVEIRNAARKKARKCNVRHLEPLSLAVNSASEDEVKKALGL